METQADFFKRLNTNLDSLVEKVESLQGLTTAQWSWTPGKDVWSVATTLDHLNTSNGLVLPLYRKALDELKAKNLKGTPDIRYTLFERRFIQMVSPNPPFKVPVAPIFRPKISDVDGGSALKTFVEQHHEIRQIMQECVGYDIMKVKITSPAAKFIHFRMGAELDALLCHDLYHWLQIEERRQASRFPK